MAEEDDSVAAFVDVRIHGDYEGLKNHMKVFQKAISGYQRVSIYFYQDGDVTQLYFPTEPIPIDFWSQLLGIYYVLEQNHPVHICIPLDTASVRSHSCELVFANNGKACIPPSEKSLSYRKISLYQCYVAYHQSGTLNRWTSNCLGGTFDQLHPGHKVLLSIGCILCEKTLTIGLTMPSLLTKKKHAHHIKSFEDRKKEVLAFVERVYRRCDYNVVGLEDAYGPALTDPYMDLITVSYETYEAIHKLNQLREEKGFLRIDDHQIPLLFHHIDGEDDGSFDMKEKISSSEIRAAIRS